MNISFQKATISQTPLAFELLKKAALRLKSKQIDQWQYWLNPPVEKVEWINEGFKNEEFFFIKDASTIIGMFRLMKEDLIYWSEQASPAIYLHSLVIIDEYTGFQIGRKILEDVIKEAQQSGVPFFRLDCNAINSQLCSYYESFGFVKVGEVQMFHSLNNLYEINLTSSILNYS